MFKTKSFWYISLFSLLYLITAGSSFVHAISFFGLANNSWMSLILAFAFELGQAVTLFSLLTSKKDRNRIMPWVLMTMFTLVQVIGNVFSSYKHIITNSVEDLKYFKEPIFIWTDLPDQEATVIVTWAIGAILPIAALLITSMITNYLTDQEEENNNKNLPLINEENKEKSEKVLEEAPETPIIVKEEDSLLNQNSILHMENQSLQEQVDKLKEELNKKENIEEKKIEEQNIEKEIKNEQEEKPNNDNDQQQLGGTEDQGNSEGELSKSTTEADEPKSDGEHILGESAESIKEENIDKNIQIADVLMGGNILKEKPKKPSHFIN